MSWEYIPNRWLAPRSLSLGVFLRTLNLRLSVSASTCPSFSQVHPDWGVYILIGSSPATIDEFYLSFLVSVLPSLLVFNPVSILLVLCGQLWLVDLMSISTFDCSFLKHHPWKRGPVLPMLCFTTAHVLLWHWNLALSLWVCGYIFQKMLILTPTVHAISSLITSPL